MNDSAAPACGGMPPQEAPLATMGRAGGHFPPSTRPARPAIGLRATKHTETFGSGLAKLGFKGPGGKSPGCTGLSVDG
jgi:hypothetical protein